MEAVELRGRETFAPECFELLRRAHRRCAAREREGQQRSRQDAPRDEATIVREAFPGRTDVVGLTACFITFPDLQHLSGADNPVACEQVRIVSPIARWQRGDRVGTTGVDGRPGASSDWTDSA